MMLRTYLLKLFLFLFLYGCSEDSGIIKINLSDVEDNARGVSLNAVADSIQVIEFNSEDILISNLNIIGEADHRIYGYSTAGDIYIFTDKGQLLKTFNRTGRGPGEYLYIWDAKLDETARQLVILDLRNKLLKFSPDGELLEENSGELVRSIAEIAPCGNGYYAGTLINTEKKKNNIIIFDRKYQIVNKYFPVKEVSQKNTSGIMMMESVKVYDSKVVYKSALGDTVYSIFADHTQPLLTVWQGKLKMPSELSIKADNETDGRKSKYINNFNGKLAGRYYLGSYWYKDLDYYDLWDLKDGSNIIHQPFTDELYDTGAQGGVPVEINGRVLYTWPGYVQNNVLYAVCDYSYFHQSDLEEDENKNPVLVKIWLKK